MQKLNLPAYDFRVRESGRQVQIFDKIRKKYVILTPEEWVRQHFVHYLIQYLSFPKTLIKVEFGIAYNNLSKRPDILIISPNGKPILLVECKSPDVKLSNKVLEQISIYNKIINAPYSVVTNGIQHICWDYDETTKAINFLKSIPNYEDTKSTF